MQKPTHPDRYAQFIRKPNDNKLDSINRFDGNAYFNSSNKVKMYPYNKKTKKVSLKEELVSKIDAEGKHMQGTHLYVDKEMNTKEENKILEKFLKEEFKEKQLKNVKQRIKNQFFTRKVINEINRKEKLVPKLSIKRQRMENYNNYIKYMNEQNNNNGKNVNTSIPETNRYNLRKYKIKNKNYGFRKN